MRIYTGNYFGKKSLFIIFVGGFETELLGVSPGSIICKTFVNLAKNDEIISKNQFTATATQPQRNRKFCQFNKDQYCTCDLRKFGLWRGKMNRF